MEWQEVMGHLAGHLHLFLGMSALSFVEIAEVLVFALIRLFFPLKTKIGPQDVAAQEQSAENADNAESLNNTDLMESEKTQRFATNKHKKQANIDSFVPYYFNQDL